MQEIHVTGVVNRFELVDQNRETYLYHVLALPCEIGAIFLIRYPLWSRFLGILNQDETHTIVFRTRAMFGIFVEGALFNGGIGHIRAQTGQHFGRIAKSAAIEWKFFPVHGLLKLLEL